MTTETSTRIAILGAGPVGLEAALASDDLRPDLVKDDLGDTPVPPTASPPNVNARRPGGTSGTTSRPKTAA